ncbi:hypothetical protein MHK_007643 [Candidatus Magnetomorum sp. HK-1]|nr:hypothetical protein MHK_007643 [Candidatus Magnetomorum sp. HK-1]
MRSINLANEKKRDARVSYEANRQKSNVEYVLKDGSPRQTVKILKNTLDQSVAVLENKFGSMTDVAAAIIDSDPEVNPEVSGMIIDSSRKLFISKDNEILYGVDLFEVTKAPDGSEKDRQFFNRQPSNVNSEIPIRCTGKRIPKDKAIRMFVFSRKYQIKHVNGLTYDFLFDIAQSLHDDNSMMLVGGGPKGTDPLVFYEGGTAFRAFLEGRVNKDKYCLILHLTQLELKEVAS